MSRGLESVRRLGGAMAAFVVVAGGVLLALPGRGPTATQVSGGAAPCQVVGHVTAGATPLPGVALAASRDGRVLAATSTDEAGAYRLRVPAGEYSLSAELAAFAKVEQPLALDASGSACSRTIDIALGLASRAAGAAPAPKAAASAQIEAPSSLRRPARLGAPNGQSTAAQPGQPRFAQLQVVESNSAGAVENTSGTIDANDPAARLLPPGFSTEAATSVVAVTGDAVNLDRGQLRDRLDALGRGEFDPAGFQPPEGFAGRFGGGGPGGGFGGPGGPAGFAGGQGGPPIDGRGFGGRGGGGRGGGFLGRGRGRNPIQGSANYTFGGSVLDASPYPLRANTQTDPAYSRQQFGFTIGGPLRIPGVYSGSKTTFFFNYAGGRASNLVDQYATVPSLALRAGDFSGLPVTPIDPATGLPFPDGRIPQDRIDPASASLLQFIPDPNLPGSTQNYRRSTTSLTNSDGFSLRLTHNFSGAQGRGGGGRGGGAFFGRGRGAGARGGSAVVLNAQVQYRRNDSDVVNVFSTLGGYNTGTTLSAPISLNILRGRAVHNVQVNLTRTTSGVANNFSNLVNVTGNAGIGGVSTDPFDWGVPNVSFSTFTSLRDAAPDSRSDRRFQLSYNLTRPFNRHAFRLGGDMRFDNSLGLNNSNARGTFVFTGLYSAAGTRSTGLDFADFLLGLPQQATVQYADKVALRGKSFSLFAQDDWRFRGNLTLNLGVRYELVLPYTEANGRMVNLDVAPDFTAAVPVLSGASGPFNGSYPTGLINGDYNNVAPRVGVAWRLTPRTIVRGGYGTSFNNGSYASIARQLVAQPPFAVTNTSIGSLSDPLSFADPFADVSESTTTNNFGVDKGYQLGVIDTWNVDVNRNAGRGWQYGVGYTGTRGNRLDVVRAPNRDPDGLRIDGVQPFLWQTSDGRSTLHSMTVRLRKQQARGLAGSLTYTLAKSMDDASSIGGGGQVVAQDDRNLAAEWGLSSFDRRHQLTGNLSLELPFGSNRRWLTRGGLWAGMLADWSLSTSITAQSGTPLTARLVGAASDVARGTNGTLRADYTGAPITINDPTLLNFFNTGAFAVPLSGTFGSAGRNTIIGPAQQQVDASLVRDVRLNQTQVVSIQLQATNLFNSVRFGAIDTVVNSPTFGQVVSIRPMRSVQLNLRFRF